MALVQLDNTITIAMSVRDRKASAKWYEDMLGFTKAFEIDEAHWLRSAPQTDAALDDTVERAVQAGKKAPARRRSKRASHIISRKAETATAAS